MKLGADFKQEKSTTELMVEYMNEKYDDTFAYSAPFGGGAGAKTLQIIVSSEKFPESRIWVEYSKESDKFSDNYIDYKYARAVENYLEDAVTEAFGCNAKASRSISTSGSYADYTNETTFEEYMNTSTQQIGVSIVIEGVSIENKEEVEKKLSSVFDQNIAGYFGKVYFVELDEDVELFFEKDLSEQQKYNYVFINKACGSVTTYRWR